MYYIVEIVTFGGVFYALNFLAKYSFIENSDILNYGRGVLQIRINSDIRGGGGQKSVQKFGYPKCMIP